MTSSSKIVGLSRHLPDNTEHSEQDTVAEFVDTDESHLFGGVPSESDEPVYDADEARLVRRASTIIVPAMIGLAFVIWTGFFGWTYFGEAQLGLTGERAVALIGLWAVPALLLGVVWLLVMRTSRAEAMRFGDVARLLRVESEALAGSRAGSALGIGGARCAR